MAGVISLSLVIGKTLPRIGFWMSFYGNDTNDTFISKIIAHDILYDLC